MSALNAKIAEPLTAAQIDWLIMHIKCLPHFATNPDIRYLPQIEHIIKSCATNFYSNE